LRATEPLRIASVSRNAYGPVTPRGVDWTHDPGRTVNTAARNSLYGLCQIYENEFWHYELRREATDHGCPRKHADATQDPRMEQ
jgi:hypothetical protein